MSGVLIVIVVVVGILVASGAWVVRGVRAQTSEPLERVDFWSVPHQPRPAVERFRALGFEPLGAVRIGVGDNALYRSVCWSERLQAFASQTTGGVRVAVDGKPAFMTPVRGGSLITTGSVPEYVLPHQLEQGFPGCTVDALLEHHLRGLAFLEAQGVPRAPVDPTTWFDHLQSERREEGVAVRELGGVTLVLMLLRVLVHAGGGPLEDQRDIRARLHQAPFVASSERG